MDNAFAAISLASLAGFLNGAYIAPIKKQSSSNSATWVLFGAITFLILPIIAVSYGLMQHSFELPARYFIYILLVGVLFGSGMYLTTKSVQYIGLGIPFALSIALGTLSGSLFSTLLLGNRILTWHLLSYLIFIVSIVLYSISLNIRDKVQNKDWSKGLVICLIGSVLCATQGAALSYFSNYFKASDQGLSAQLIPWALIFISCSFIFMLSHHIDGKQSEQVVDWRYAIRASFIMSLLYGFSVILYTVGNTMTASFSEQYLWAIFMGCIIISSTIFSYAKDEWKQCSLKGNLINGLAIVFLICSLILITLNSID
jgi:drug/metabolite transporter (DMT)-like permease